MSRMSASEIDLSRARAVLEQAVAQRATPGAVAVVLDRYGSHAHISVGRLSYEAASPPATLETMYDLASLTKLFTTTAALVLLGRGLVCLDDAVSRFLPAFAEPDKQPITVRHLLTHTAGLRAWYPLYTLARDPMTVASAIARLPLTSTPGARVEYSDLGYIVLGLVLERIASQPLDRVLSELVLEPLGLEHSGFTPEPASWQRIAPTELGNAYEARKVADMGLAFTGWTRGMLRGRVHDGNAAYGMGGVSGHAGLFASAPDVARWARLWLDGGSGLLHHRVVETATRSWTGHLEEDRGLGWRLYSPRPEEIPPGQARSGGDLLTDAAFGHTGFTGTSIWIDPRLGIGVVLLANRVHPAVEPDHFSRVRSLFHNAVVAGL